RLRQQAERGAAVGPDREQLASAGAFLGRFPAEQGEGELVARVEERNDRLALAAARGDAAHLLGITGALRSDRLPPPLGFGEGGVALEAGSRETPQIGRDVVGDLRCEAPTVGEAAVMG